MNAFIKFNKGILTMPMGWQVWLMVLVAHNMVVPLFYFGRPEAQVVFATLLASMGLMMLITARTGFTRLCWDSATSSGCQCSFGCGHSFRRSLPTISSGSGSCR